jgi:Tol biopolymer transport system component
MQVLKTPAAPWPDRGVVSILETMDVDTGKRTILKEFEDTIEAPNWTQDGKALIYNGNGRLHRYDLAAGTIADIDSGFAARCNNDHVLSPDGKSIAISHQTTEDNQSRIYTLPITGGGPVLITPIAPSYLHGWSPDGKTLAYCADRNGQFEIYTIPVHGGVETQLTDNPGLDDGPEYSSDGRHIWFCSTRTGMMQVWRMNANGADQTQMTSDDSNNWFGHISPDGERVICISYRKGDVKAHEHPPNKDVQLKLFPAKGGATRVLAEFFGGQGTINVNSWSPDNKNIAFVSYRLKK